MGRWHIQRTPKLVMAFHLPTTLGVSLHRGRPGGAVSFQCRGHFLQLVFGDWWRPWA